MTKALLLAGLALAVVPRTAPAQGVASSNAKPVKTVKSSGLRWDAKFTDIAAEAGLDLRFTSGGEDSKNYIIESNGSGVAFLDYDDDGRIDIFLVNGSSLDGFGDSAAPTNRLYRNKNGSKFEDVTERAGMARSGWGSAVCAGDYDNDGGLDVFVAYWGVNALFHNDREGAFEEVATVAGVAGGEDQWSSGCSFVDYDRDGLLDLIVTDYQQFDLATAAPPGEASNCEWKGMPVYCGPRGLPFGNVTLFRNEGDGTFEDVSVVAGVRAVKDYYAFTAVAADFDQDGWQDIYIACDSTPSIFFLNNGDGTFTDFATETGLAFNEHGFEQGGMGIGVGDFDRNGLLDLIKTNFAGDYPNVYQNQERGFFEDIVVRAGVAVNPNFVGWGVEYVDLDNDGWQDIFQVNGHVYPELDRQSKVNETYVQSNLVYRNLGDGVFEEVTALAGPGLSVKKSSRGAAFGDFDDDGDIDVVVMNMAETASLLRNDLDNKNHWVKIKLRGTKSNRSAIGATVTIEANGGQQTEAVLSQSSYVSHNDLRVHFGLGSMDKIDGITVRWPSGEVEEFPATAGDRVLLLVEGSGEVTGVE